MKKGLLSILAASFLFAGSAFAKDFNVIKEHSSVEFKIKHLQISNVKGTFDDFDAKIDFDTKKKVLKVLEATVKSASIDTKNSQRDDHMRSSEYLDVSEYPEMKFKMKNLKLSGDKGVLTADLTIKNVTKPVKFNYEFNGVTKFKGKDILAFSLSTIIDRVDFNVGEKTLILSNDVKIDVEIEAIED